MPVQRTATALVNAMPVEFISCLDEYTSSKGPVFASVELTLKLDFLDVVAALWLYADGTIEELRADPATARLCVVEALFNSGLSELGGVRAEVEAVLPGTDARVDDLRGLAWDLFPPLAAEPAARVAAPRRTRSSSAARESGALAVAR